MNNLVIKKFTLRTSAISLLFKNYLLVEVIHLLIRFSKTKYFKLNTKNTGINGIKNTIRPHTHTHTHTHTQITLEKVCKC